MSINGRHPEQPDDELSELREQLRAAQERAAELQDRAWLAEAAFTHLQTAARPTAQLLANLNARGRLGLDVHEAITGALTTLNAALTGSADLHRIQTELDFARLEAAALREAATLIRTAVHFAHITIEQPGKWDTLCELIKAKIDAVTPRQAP